MNAAVYGAAANAMGGLLGATAGQSSSEAEARIEEAKKTATDLTGLVRKKNKDEVKSTAEAVETTANGHETNGHGKRKAEEPAEAITETDPKKAKVDDSAEA